MRKEDLRIIAMLVDDIFNKISLDRRALEMTTEFFIEEKRRAGLSPSDLYYIRMADRASWPTRGWNSISFWHIFPTE